MSKDLLEIIGQIVGIGGPVLATLTLVYRDIIAKNIFPKLKRDDAYRLLRLMAILVFIVALAGIAAWVAPEVFGARDDVSPPIETQGDNSPVVSGAEGNVTITIDTNPLSSGPQESRP